MLKANITFTSKEIVIPRSLRFIDYSWSGKSFGIPVVTVRMIVDARYQAWQYCDYLKHSVIFSGCSSIVIQRATL